MRSFSAFVFALVLGSLVGFVQPALGALVTMFQDDFELDASGTSLSACTPEVGVGYSNVGSCLVSNTAWVQSVTDPGPSTPGQFAGSSWANGQTAVAWPKISNANKTLATNQVVTFKLDVWEQSGTGASDQDQFIGTFGDTSYNNGSFDIKLGSDGSVWSYDSNSAFNARGTYSTNAWVPVTIVADFSAKTYHATVGSLAWDGTFRTDTGTGNNTFQYMFLQHNGGGNGVFDNLLITTGQVPEPSTLLLITTGSIGLLAYAWRKRK